MRQHVQAALDALLHKRLAPADLAVEADRIEAQRRRFLLEFNPERLSQLSTRELLRHLPYNTVHPEPLDYWLESRTDAAFDTRRFGDIAGGVAKFGLWQDKASGQWRSRGAGSRSARPLHEDEALAIVARRREEIINACSALDSVTAGKPPHAQDPEAVQKALAAAAPHAHASAWLHKYLHLIFPDYVTCFATAPRLQAVLYRLGAEVRGAGIYALDLGLLRYLHGLSALKSFPVATRYRLFSSLTPRDHWCFHAPDPAVREMLLANGCIATEPTAVGNVAGVLSLQKKAEAHQGLKLAFQEAGVGSDTERIKDLLDLGYSLKSGSLVGLLSDAQTVIAVGETQGGYCHRFASPRPHRVAVRWLHPQPFELTRPLTFSKGSLLRLPAHDPTVVELEASLLINGLWPADAPAMSGSCNRYKNTAPAVNLPAPEPLVQQLLEMLERKNQIILYGPPGTGKTHYAEQTAWEMLARRNFSRTPGELSPRQREHVLGQGEHDPYLVFCAFHPMFAYEDFIEGYRPDADGFSLKPGIMRRLATSAQARLDKRFVLIIDEINRGNISQIFGELITLLEPGKRGQLSIRLPLSGASFTLPPNLFVIATMNTADRSISLLDTALRRRFGFAELLPNAELLDQRPMGPVTLGAWLRSLNRRLREQLGRDGRNLQVGHAYFMAAGKPVSTLPEIAAILRQDIWPLLQEYCYEDPEALTAILAADQGGIYDHPSADLRHELFTPGQETALCEALAAMVTHADKITATEEATETDAIRGRVEKMSAYKYK